MSWILTGGGEKLQVYVNSSLSTDMAIADVILKYLT